MINILLSIFAVSFVAATQAFAADEAIPTGAYTFTYPDPTGRTVTSRTDNIQILHSAHLQDDDVYIRYRNPSDSSCPNQICGRSVKISQLQMMDTTYWGSRLQTLKTVVSLGMYEATPPCPECEAARLGQPRQNGTVRMRIPSASEYVYRNRFPMSSAESFLKLDPIRKMACPGRVYLHQSRDLLLRAEQAFRIPAASMACLIGKESKWNPAAVSDTGYQGLVQTRAGNANTTRSWVTPNARKEPPFDQMLLDQWNRATNNQPVGDMVIGNMYRTGNISAGDKRKIANVSIGFLGVYLNYIQKREFKRLWDTYGQEVAIAFSDSDTSRAIAYVGYNAGHNRVDDMIPPEAFKTPYWCKQLAANRRPRDLPRGFTVQSNCGNAELSWVANMRTPGKAGPRVRTDAMEYVREIHRCEASQWWRAAPAEEARRPKDECGL